MIPFKEQKKSSESDWKALFASTPPVPDFLKPKLRLFLSADIAGSTAAKQREANFHKTVHDPEQASNSLPQSEWIAATMFFYERFANGFPLAWEGALKACGAPESDLKRNPPTYWKAIGDEILFHQVVVEPWHASLAVGMWTHFIKEVRKELREGYPTLNLDIKGAAWLAGFPIINTEIIVNAPRTEGKKDGATGEEDFPIYKNMQSLADYYKSGATSTKHKGELDFIGPLIDIGFRLSSLASPGRIVVSAEIAYLMSGNGLPNDTRLSTLLEAYPEFPPLRNALVYEGRTNLKGVGGSMGYPVFYLPMGLKNEVYGLEERFALRKFERDPQDVKDPAFLLCEAFFRESSFCEPYIVKPDDGCFCAGLQPPPLGHISRLKKLLALWNKAQEIDKQNVAISESAQNVGTKSSDQAGNIDSEKIIGASIAVVELVQESLLNPTDKEKPEQRAASTVKKRKIPLRKPKAVERKSRAPRNRRRIK